MNLSELLPWNWFHSRRDAPPPQPAGTGLRIVRAPEGEEGWPDPDSLESVRYELDRLLDHGFSGFGFSAPHLQATRPFVSPRIRQERRLDGYRLEADLPGVREQDLTLTLRGRTLTLLAPRLADHREHAASGRAAYRTVFVLEQDADLGAIALFFKDFLLTLWIPRRDAASTYTEG